MASKHRDKSGASLIKAIATPDGLPAADYIFKDDLDSEAAAAR
jgi:hypothetical protein